VALGLPVERFDAESNARTVRRSWGQIGHGADPRKTPARNHATLKKAP
jgi:hypothetical protein